MEVLESSINPSIAAYPEDMKPSYLNLSLEGTRENDGGMSTFGPVIVVLMCSALIVLVAVAVVAVVAYRCKKSKSSVRRYERLQPEEENDVGKECK